MSLRTNLWINTALRALQMLFGIIVLGNSVTLAKGFYDGVDPERKDTYEAAELKYSSVPFILPWASTVGALTFIAGGVSIFIAWTEYFGEYVEMLIDAIIVFANVVAGTLLAIKIKGKNCNDEDQRNQVGDKGEWPYAGSLAAVDIFRGACYEFQGNRVCLNADNSDRYIWLNKRCKQSNADLAVVWLTVVLLLGTLTLTYLRLKQNR